MDRKISLKNINTQSNKNIDFFLMEIVVFFQGIKITDMKYKFNFKLLSKDKNARLGKLETAH